MTAATQLHVFRSSIKSIQVVTGSGRKILFVNGIFYTKHPEEIEFLNSMVQDNRGIYVDAGRAVIDEGDLDPMATLKAKLRQELLAEMQVQLNPENDRGNYTQGPLNATSTRDAAPVAAGGDASQLHAQVAKLIPGKTSK